MKRELLLAVTMVLLCAFAAVSAQTPAPETRPAFDVASIKRNVSGEQASSMRPSGADGIAITNYSLFNIIRNAYNVQAFQIVGGPDWLDRDRWNVLAKAEGVTQPQQLMVRLQTLIADRFNADVRRETREMQVYALTLARADRRLGPGLRPAAADCDALRAAARPGDPLPRRAGGLPSCGMNVTPGRASAGGYLIADIARNLSNASGRILIDRTGLTERYDMELEWTPDGTQPAPGVNDAGSFFTAVQEQLGLKLEPQRAPVEVIVVYTAERAVDD